MSTKSPYFLDSVDKIVQGNTSNIVFLKSTDDSMLDTLQKMSGTTHKAYTDSKTVTKDMEKIWMQNEGKVSYTMTTREQPVISYNDMAFIAERNSIVFRAGDSPIWNRNETILPMSWRLFKNTIKQPGKEYSLQTIPTLSSAIDFDVRQNQPDFRKMLDKRMQQAIVATQAKEMYQSAYNYDDYDIEQLDPDIYSDEVMDLVNRIIRAQNEESEQDAYDDDAEYEQEFHPEWAEKVEDNTEQAVETAKATEMYKNHTAKIYANGMLSKEDLVSMGNKINHAFDKDIINAYVEVKGHMWNDTDYFINRDGSLYGIDGKLYIKSLHASAELSQLNDAAKDETSNVFSESDITENDLSAFGSYEVTDDFYRFLVSLDSWKFAKGEFDNEMYRQLK